MFSKQQNYKLVTDQGRYADSSSPGPEVEEHGFNVKIRTKQTSRLPWFLCFFMLALNILVISAYTVQKHKPSGLGRELSYRSALFDTVTISFNGSLFPSKKSSWSRLGPSQEADNLWDWYEPLRLVPLSKADVIGLGKDPAKAAQFPSSWDVPSGSYIGALDVFHKIHCLNELRKMTFEGYPGENTSRTYKHHSALQWFHLRHCVDMIAQELQCNAKLDVITYNWMDTQKQPFPDFSVSKSCTNWDQFADWTVKNILDPEEFHNLRRPLDVQPIPAEQGYYEMFGFEESVLYPAGNGYESQA